ncbi:hypothetical protein ACFE04_019968 [Oxalis oulophora]
MSSQSLSLTFKTPAFSLFPKIPLITPPKLNLHTSSISCASLDITEQQILQFVADSNGNSTTLPCVRTYENDLARFGLVGAVSFDQALTAAAADGGQAADEHIDSGIPAMVIETVYPGVVDEHSTVSTRLFLPANKVKEKAKKLRKSFDRDFMMSGSSISRNVLAMTFRQVVLQQLWNFELAVFSPGTERNMQDLENAREVPAYFTLSSSDGVVISMLAEAVCISALQTTERNFLHNLLGNYFISFFSWFKDRKRITSKDSSVIIDKLFEEEIVRNAKSLLEKFNFAKENLTPIKVKPKSRWWTPSVLSSLEKIGGPEFSAWASEYLPAYRIQIDASKLGDVKFEGWRKSADDQWEVGLADILDMYYEDIYSLPNKQLSGGVTANLTNLPNKKRSASFFKIISFTMATGVFLISISSLGQLFSTRLNMGGRYIREQKYVPTSEIEYAVNHSLDSAKSCQTEEMWLVYASLKEKENKGLCIKFFIRNLLEGNEQGCAGLLEGLCTSIIERLKEAFKWSGDDVMTDAAVGAWIGEIPKYLKTIDEADSTGYITNSTTSENIGNDMKSSALDIASYQFEVKLESYPNHALSDVLSGNILLCFLVLVVLSIDGKVVGFQPTSRIGVNHWAANPLAKELYGRKTLSPGFFEPGLKIQLPNEVVVLELLMSVNPDYHFALARPIEITS